MVVRGSVVRAILIFRNPLFEEMRGEEFGSSSYWNRLVALKRFNISERAVLATADDAHYGNAEKGWLLMPARDQPGNQAGDHSRSEDEENGGS